MKKNLMTKAKITSTPMTKLWKNETVSMEVLGRICRVFNCNIGDLVDVSFEDQ